MAAAGPDVPQGLVRDVEDGAGGEAFDALTRKLGRERAVTAMRQAQRRKLEKFLKGETTVLVATKAIQFGVDLPRVRQVIFALPSIHATPSGQPFTQLLDI